MRLLTFLFLILSVLGSGYPGIRTTISIKSLNAYVQQILPEIIEKASSDKMEDVTLWIRPLFIPVKVVLSELDVHSISVDVSKSIISVNNSTKEMYLTLPNVDLLLSGIYSYYIPFRLSGHFNLTLTDCTLVIPMKYLVTKEGEIDIEMGD